MDTFLSHKAKKGVKMKKIGLILLLVSILVGCASTGQSPKVGSVGLTAPDFSTIDVSGEEVRLSDFKGEKNLVLVFYSDST